ncbi:hypothetical protein TWF594_001884 [Orbilia oligospora]|nr:hypothetical protein TWF594_001884 [Orbilia oligospora]
MNETLTLLGRNPRRLTADTECLREAKDISDSRAAWCSFLSSEHVKAPTKKAGVLKCVETRPPCFSTPQLGVWIDLNSIGLGFVAGKYNSGAAVTLRVLFVGGK